jgi:chromodomain-helicase-DNA-binding protein 1
VVTYRHSFVTKGTIEEDILERAKRKMILEYASKSMSLPSMSSSQFPVINQMDTTGAHINGASAPKEKTGDFSKDELAAILKFGAQNIYKTDDNAQSKKLDEMDLDDILTKADAFDTDATAVPGTTSLGGEGFLSQFAAIQDVKNDLEGVSWDDIIPADERIKLDEDESKALAAEEAAKMGGAPRKRAAARPPGTYEGMDHDDNDGTGTPSGDKKGGSRSAAFRKSNAQKALDLKERDLRVLIRGLQKWGDIRTRYDPIVKEAKLEGKNRVIIIQTAEEIIAEAEETIAQHRAHLKGLQDRGEPITSQLRQKAVLFSYNTVGGLNAETIVARHYELKAVIAHLERYTAEHQGKNGEDSLEGYAIPVDSLKPTMNWSVDWTDADDAHLLIGIWRYGFGSWESLSTVSVLNGMEHALIGYRIQPCT